MTGFSIPNHTQTPNDLFDCHMASMGEAELKVVLAVIRKTLGYHKQREPISLTQFETLTGLSRQGCLDGINAALEHGFICAVKKPGKSSTYEMRFVATSTGQASGLVEEASLVKQVDQTSQASRPLTSQASRHTKERNKETPQKKESIAPVGAQDAPAPKSTPSKKRKPDATPAERINPIKDAIAAAFGWDWARMTKFEQGTVQKAAKALADAGRTPDDVAVIHAYCKRQAWKGGFTPMALATHASAALQTATPVLATSLPMTPIGPAVRRQSDGGLVTASGGVWYPTAPLPPKLEGSNS